MGFFQQVFVIVDLDYRVINHASSRNESYSHAICSSYAQRQRYGWRQWGCINVTNGKTRFHVMGNFRVRYTGVLHNLELVEIRIRLCLPTKHTCIIFILLLHHKRTTINYSITIALFLRHYTHRENSTDLSVVFAFRGFRSNIHFTPECITIHVSFF